MVALNKGDEIEVISFYEELKVKGKIKITDIDVERELIEFTVSDYLTRAIKESKRLYYVLDRRVYASDVLFFQDKLFCASFFRRVYEPKFDRKFVRVTVSISSPVFVEVENYYSPFETFECRALDISEGGIGILVKKEYPLRFEDVLNLKMFFSLRGRDTEIHAKGKVVRIEDLKKVKKLGIVFLDISQSDKDRIAQYIAYRQREIIKTLKELS